MPFLQTVRDRAALVIAILAMIVVVGLSPFTSGLLGAAVLYVVFVRPYRWLGHPLYAGSSIMGVGLAIAANSVVVAVLIALYLLTTISAAIRSEEAFLRQKFGDAYDRYRSGPAAGDGSAESRRFSLQQAIANREHRAVAGLAIAVLLLVLKATYNGLFWRMGAGH